jgi:hypothetical protein
MGSTNLPEDPKRPDARRDLPNPEAALGGADDVQKTSYVTGSGTDPERRKTSREPNARVGGGGMGIGGWILIAVVVGIALFYGASLFR